jgi:hypothetical protein
LRESAEHRERRAEAAVNRDLADAGALVEAAPRPLDRRINIGHEHHVDRLPNLSEHQAADLPVAEVRGQEENSLAPGPPLENVLVALD